MNTSVNENLSAQNKALSKIKDALVLLENTAITAREDWKKAKQSNDEEKLKEARKLKVKIHNLIKKAVMELTAHGFGSIKGYYVCNAVPHSPHLLCIDFMNKEFFIPISHKTPKQAPIPFLGERGLSSIDNQFDPNMSLDQAFALVNTYINPNYEAQQEKYRLKKKDGKKSFKKSERKPAQSNKVA